MKGCRQHKSNHKSQCCPVQSTRGLKLKPQALAQLQVAPPYVTGPAFKAVQLVMEPDYIVNVRDHYRDLDYNTVSSTKSLAVIPF